MSLDIAWSFFWLPEKASLFTFGKIAFSAEKAISSKFGKIVSWGLQDARNCVRVVLAPWKSAPFEVRKNYLFGSLRRSKWRQGCSGALKMRPLSGSEKSLLQLKNYFFQVRKNSFFRSPRRYKLRQGSSSALKTLLFQTRRNRSLSWKKRFLSDSENSCFQVAKTHEIASRLFWHPQKASPFRFGKIAFTAEKTISFRSGIVTFPAEIVNSIRFGKIAFSGLTHARNCIKVDLVPRKSTPFQVWKNRRFTTK